MDRKHLTVLTALTLLLATVLLVPTSVAPAHATGTIFNNTLFFDQFTCCVGKVSFTYDSSGPSLTLGTATILNSALPGGADGLVFDPQNGNLLIGQPGFSSIAAVNEVDPTNGALITQIPTCFPLTCMLPSHLMVDPLETTGWTTSDGQGAASLLVSIPLNPLGNAVSHTLSGDDTFVNTIAWQDESHAFYTSSACCGGFGHFGRIDLTTLTTTCLKVSGSCEVFPGAHGMAFDPFTKTVIMFGDSHVTQIDPSTLSVVSDLSIGIGPLDQGAVDGHGHLIAACNCGLLFFEDFAASGLVGSPTFSTSAPINGPSGNLCCLDDVAPLIPPGAPPQQAVSKFFTLLRPTLAAGQTFLPLNTRLTWSVDYVVANIFSTPMTSVVLKDHFAASLAVDTSTIVFSAPAGSGASAPIFTTSNGASAQWSFTWSIGTLQPGQTASFSVRVTTDKNPSGAQEFTSPGLQVLNTGATLKWTPTGQAMQSSTTLPVAVMAGNTVGAIDGVVSSQGSPVQSVKVSLFSGASPVSTSTTSVAGFYHFDVVTPGVYTVSVTTATGTASVTVSVSAGVIATKNLMT